MSRLIERAGLGTAAVAAGSLVVSGMGVFNGEAGRTANGQSDTSPSIPPITEPSASPFASEKPLDSVVV